MNALAQQGYGAPDAPDIPRRLARVSGPLYLVAAMLGTFATTVLLHLVTPGDASATAHHILDSLWLFASGLVALTMIVVADIVVALTLYLASLFAADSTGAAATAVLAPALLGESGLTAWLLVKGVNARRGAPPGKPRSAGFLSADVHVGAATEGTR